MSEEWAEFWRVCFGFALIAAWLAMWVLVGFP